MTANRMPKTTSGRPIVVMGAGHQGRNVNDILIGCQAEVLGFLDDTKKPGEQINGVPVLGGFTLSEDGDLLSRAAFIVALGDNRIRRELSRGILRRGGVLTCAIHPAADISPSACLGDSLYVQAFARILANSRVGDFALIEGLTTIGSDVVIGEAGFVGPGAQLTAGSRLGDGAFIGANAVVIGPAKVGTEAVIGAGAVVVTDIPDRVLALGVPCRIARALTELDTPTSVIFARPGKAPQ